LGENAVKRKESGHCCSVSSKRAVMGILADFLNASGLVSDATTVLVLAKLVQDLVHKLLQLSR
jgi:hypothetical protein